MELYKKAVFELAKALGRYLCNIYIEHFRILCTEEKRTLRETFCGIVLRDIYDTFCEEIIWVYSVENPGQFDCNFMDESLMDF